MKAHFLFKDLNDDLVDEIKSSSSVKRFDKSEVVYLQEDEARYIYIMSRMVG